MAKLDNDIKSIIDDMSAQANALIPAMLEIMLNQDLEKDEVMQKIEQMLKDSQPKTYDIYIHDIKQAFRNDGWKEPELGIE